MIFSGEDETKIWQAFLTKYEARLTAQENDDLCRLDIVINRHRRFAVELWRDDNFLVASASVGQASTTSMLQLSLTFMGWQEYPQYAISLRADAYLSLGCARYWPSAHSDRDLYDLTLGLAQSADLLHTALTRSLYPSAPVKAR